MCSTDAIAQGRFAKDCYHIGNDNRSKPSFACFFPSMSTHLDTFLSAHSGNIFYARATHATVSGCKFGPKHGGNKELG